MKGHEERKVALEVPGAPLEPISSTPGSDGRDRENVKSSASRSKESREIEGSNTVANTPPQTPAGATSRLPSAWSLEELDVQPSTPEVQSAGSAHTAQVRNISPNSASPKSRLLLSILSLLLGWAGIHRFYVRKYGTGVLMLLTFGGFYIWWLIDTVVALAGKFRDKDGRLVMNWKSEKVST